MNNIKNGMIILEQTNTSQQAVFIDEEHLHYMRLNAMFKKRDNERAVQDKIQEDKNSVKEHHKRMWKMYTTKTFTFIGVRVMLTIATMLTMLTNLVNPIVAIPVSLYFLITTCIRFGMWFSKYINRKS